MGVFLKYLINPFINSIYRAFLGFFKSFFLVLILLLPSHLIFSFFMKSFNTRLGIISKCAYEMGFVVLPGPATLPDPSSWSTASASAVFFTMTLGALSCSLGFLSAAFFSRKTKHRLYFIFAAAAVAIFFIMLSCGLNPYFSSAFSITFAVSGTARCFWQKNYEKGRGRVLVFFLFIAVIPVFFAAKGTAFFSEIRDRLLFGTSVGESVIDFYYKFNLFGAEVIKKPEKRINKAVVAVEFDRPIDLDVAARIFQQKGFAVLHDKGCAADYSLSAINGFIEVRKGGKPVARASIDEFRAEQARFFSEMYSGADNASTLRFFVFVSFFLGLPAILINITAESLSGIFVRLSRIHYLIILVVVIIGFASLFYLAKEGSGKIGFDELESKLVSSDEDERMAAMNHIIKKKIDPDRFSFSGIKPGEGSPRERILNLYLLSRSGSVDRFERISPFTEDSYSYVACQAVRFLAQLDDRRCPFLLENIIRTNPNLYVQLAALEGLSSWKKRNPILN